MKKILSVLLAVCLLAGMLPLTAGAEGPEPGMGGRVLFMHDPEDFRQALINWRFGPDNQLQLPGSEIQKVFPEAESQRPTAARWIAAVVRDLPVEGRERYCVDVTALNGEHPARFAPSDPNSHSWWLDVENGPSVIVSYFDDENMPAGTLSLQLKDGEDPVGGTATIELGRLEFFVEKEPVAIILGEVGTSAAMPEYTTPDGRTVKSWLDGDNGVAVAAATFPQGSKHYVGSFEEVPTGTRIADASCWGMYNYMYIDVAILPGDDAAPYWYQLTEKGGTEVLAEGMLNHKEDDPDAPAGARFAEMNWDSPEKAPKAGGAGYTISIFAVKDGAPQGEAISSGDFVIDGDIAKMDVYEGYPDDPFQQEVSKHITATVDNQKRVVRLQGKVKNEEDFLNLSLLGFDKEDNFLCGDRIRLEKNEDGTYTLAPLPEPNEDGGYDYLDFVNTWVANPDGTERKYTIDVSGVTSPTGGEDPTPPPVKPDFTDVPSGAFYANAVSWAVENGITTGTGAGTFSPGDACNREQIVTFLWRAAGKPEPTATANPFTDVSESSYAYKAVLWAVENNITTGTSSTTFSPKKNCTRDQAVTFLWRANGEPEPTASSSFTDVKPGSFYEKAVGWAVENGITTGAGAGIFNPGGVCTRGHIVTFLYRDKK